MGTHSLPCANHDSRTGGSVWFSVPMSSDLLSVVRGKRATSTATAAVNAGFSDTSGLSPSGTPNGVTQRYKPALYSRRQGQLQPGYLNPKRHLRRDAPIGMSGSQKQQPDFSYWQRTISTRKRWVLEGLMRHTIFAIILLILASQFALAGAGNDQPTNITVTNPYSNNVTWANVCWNTVNQSDSLVMIGETPDFARQIYNPTLTTNHCVVVQNLQPNAVFYYSVASCTDPVGGKQCDRTDTNWSSAPWPNPDSATFTTVQSTSGPLAFSAFPYGPSYVYQGAGMNVGISLIQTSGVMSSNYMMVVTEASIDGVSCLPGTLMGASCGSTGIALTMLCGNNSEMVNSQTNNYPVFLPSGPPFQGNYVCWNHYFAEPGMEARIVATGGQLRSSRLGLSTDGHTLRLILQVIDYTQNNIPVSEPAEGDLQLHGGSARPV